MNISSNLSQNYELSSNIIQFGTKAISQIAIICGASSLFCAKNKKALSEYAITCKNASISMLKKGHEMLTCTAHCIRNTTSYATKILFHEFVACLNPWTFIDYPIAFGYVNPDAILPMIHYSTTDKSGHILEAYNHGRYNEGHQMMAELMATKMRCIIIAAFLSGHYIPGALMAAYFYISMHKGK